MSNLLDVNAGVDAAIIGEGSDVSNKSAWGLMIRRPRGEDSSYLSRRGGLVTGLCKEQNMAEFFGFADIKYEET